MFKITDCKLRDLTSTLVNDIISFGWTQVSKNTTEDFLQDGSDGFILESPAYGKFGHSTIIRLKEAIDFTSPMTSDSVFYEYYFQILADYTQSELDGENGVKDNGTHISYKVSLTNPYSGIMLNPDTMMRYYLNVTDSRMYVVIEIKQLNGELLTYPTFMYAGFPASNSEFEHEAYKTQFLLASYFSYGSGNKRAFMPMSPAYGRNLLCDINYTLSTNPNPIGKFVLVPMVVTQGSFGTLGVIDDIFVLHTGSTYHGQHITVDGKRYRIFHTTQNVNPSGYVDMLGTTGLAIPIPEETVIPPTTEGTV
jgi:hypothetical protein